MAEVVSQRLRDLRKHLGGRLGQELSMPELANMAGINPDFVRRLETGLKGNTHSLVTLLAFYRSQGYNLDWILVAENSRIPMMITTGTDLLEVSSELMDLSQVLETKYKKLNTRLRTMGYRPLETQLVESDTELPEAIGLAL